MRKSERLGEHGPMKVHSLSPTNVAFLQQVDDMAHMGFHELMFSRCRVNFR